MRDRRTETMENSAVTKNALIAIKRKTDSSLRRISDPFSEDGASATNRVKERGRVIRKPQKETTVGKKDSSHNWNVRQLKLEALLWIIG
jgi:hypothetical protein